MLMGMAAVRIAVFALATLNAMLAAQTVREGSLNVTVTDQSGARVPHAVVQLRPEGSKPLIEQRTDAQGITVLSLVSGTYAVSVFAPGFKRWRSSVQLAQNSSQSIKAELQIGGVGSGYTVNDEKVIQTERQLVEVIILLEPLEYLVVLPSHKLRRSVWSHHPQS
jgi:hypothetical protein